MGGIIKEKEDGGRTGTAGTKRNVVRTHLTTGRGSEEKEAELKQTMEIPKEFWPSPEKPIREVTKDMQRQLNPHGRGLFSQENSFR